MPDFPVSEEFVRSANAAQLHDEARGTLRNWPASFTHDGGRWVYRVEREDIDAAKVAAAIKAHTPDPNYGVPAEVLTLRSLRDKASLTTTEMAAAVRALVRTVT